MSNSMKALFPGYFREEPTELSNIWQSAIFVFDANILLNLYRYSDPAREDFLRILDQIKGRVWISHQAVEEYFQNRLAVIKSQEAAYDDTMKDIVALERKLDNNRQHPFLSDESSASLQTIFVKLKKELSDSKKNHSERILIDPIKDALANIFEGKIGSPYTEEKFKELFKEGEVRYQRSIPPGYKDSNKAKEPDNYNDLKRKFGDLIVWFQTVSHASESAKDVIFVTDDKKEDWWEIFNGKTIGPRPELVKEFIDKTSRRFYMYRADTFLDHANQFLDGKIAPETLEEIKQIRLDKSIFTALQKYKPLYDLVFYLNILKLPVGSKLPSERDLADEIGYNRTVIREQLVRLESYEYVEINHGKSTVLIKELPNLNSLNSDD
jgi:hypothetical protein